MVIINIITFLSQKCSDLNEKLYTHPNIDLKDLYKSDFYSMMESIADIFAKYQFNKKHVFNQVGSAWIFSNLKVQKYIEVYQVNASPFSHPWAPGISFLFLQTTIAISI